MEREADLVVCGEGDSAGAAVDKISQIEPDLVLIDVSLPDRSGIEMVRELRRRHPALYQAMLSGHREKSHIEQAFKAVAQGYFLKGHASELPAAIRQIIRGEQYLSPVISGSGQSGNEYGRSG